jgi:tetratricopeptide (TPR) repeat protein
MLTEESTIVLPETPGDIAAAPVAAWSEPVEIDTYDVEAPDLYPAYLDRRVYQGSSGRVYPLPFFERVSSTKEPRLWEAIHLENAYVRLMILPELGGRIHFGLDKTRNYNFFYRNNVIKPALVGVTGPWLSGGVEFNWPQHHRPGTYLPVSWAIEEEADGSRTVWCADLDPLARMKGMHGVRLRPDSALVELRVRLFNRTEDVQTFLWWANVAARVGDSYQSFFPTDVHFVADHAKRAVVSFPEVRGTYYGVDYSERVTPENPEADRLDWYRNIPVPTSYMCLGSEDDFFGGYDHAVNAGFVHWADHRISPGKKQWTWGNAPFGWAWDRNLTDSDGPYVELMAGVFTDNQPDFSFLAPGETKTFSQYWFPIQDIGTVQQANRDGAVHLHVDATGITVGFVPTRPMEADLAVTVAGHAVWQARVSCAPGRPHIEKIELAIATDPTDVTFEAREDGDLVLAWTPRAVPEAISLPAAADEPPLPADVAGIEELYLTGLHLEQYHHATRSPEPYWQEALRRDPMDSRVNTALAARRFRDGLLGEAETLLRRAVARLTRRNPNPYDGEAHYRLGLVLVAQGRLKEAEDAFGKATWNAAWKTPGELARARLAGRRGDWAAVLERAEEILETDRWQNQAGALAVLALRHLGRPGEAQSRLHDLRDHDRLDWWLADLGGARVATSAATLVDIALEYASCGLHADARRLLDDAENLELAEPVVGAGNQLPLIVLHRADLLEAEGLTRQALDLIASADHLDRSRCFPGRLADALMLERLRSLAPESEVLAALHGHWLYSRGRAIEAIEAWSIAGDDPVSLRNRGVAAFNHLKDTAESVRCYERALSLAPADPRLWYERDQLAKQVGEPLADRLARLESHRDMVDARDDLSVEFVALLLGVGRSREALTVLKERCFQPWEGGEGQVLAVWERANCALAREAISSGDPATGVAFVQAAFQPPVSLGEDRHLLANVAHLDLLLGDALEAAGDVASARKSWQKAASAEGDFVAMSTTAHSERSAFSIIALQRLGRTGEAAELADEVTRWAEAERRAEAQIDYFATSLPTLLLFHEDPQVRQQLTCDVMRAQARLTLGDRDGAEQLLDEVLSVDPSEPFALEARALVGN